MIIIRTNVLSDILIAHLPDYMYDTTKFFMIMFSSLYS